MIKNISSSNPFGNSVAAFLGNYGVLICCFLIGSALLSGMVFAMMQTYAARENRLIDVTLNDFKDLLVKNAWKFLRLIIAFLVIYLLLAFLMGLFVALSVYSLIISIPLFIIACLCLIPLLLTIPVYLMERDISLIDAIRKAWKLGIATFGGLLGFMVVLYFISSVIQTVTMLPWYLMTLFGVFFSLSAESVIAQSAIYKFILYILGLIQAYGMYVTSIIGVIGLAFHYFHAREKVEGVTIESNISNFDKL